MKRFTMIAAWVVMLVMPAFAERVTPETARKVATTFLSSYGVKAELHLVDYVDHEAFPNFYVFGTENSFIIISADDCAQPVLGYSTEHPFGNGKMPENLFGWLKSYDEQIAYAAKNGQKATSETAKDWNNLLNGKGLEPKSNTTVGPLIETTWDQPYPYNNLCPPSGNPKSTGCVATAMAQIMKYWNYPTTGFGSHSYTPFSHPEYGVLTANFGTTTYNWDAMLNTYSSSNPAPTSEQEAAVALLMYHCGISVNMNYGQNGTDESGAYTSDVAIALQKYFNYSQTAHYITRASVVDENGHEDTLQWKNILKAELNADRPRPMQYRGKGHSFVCDGYDNNDMFHFNWGWGGSSNGYFYINKLTKSQYNLDQAAIIGIQPITYNECPSSLSAEVSGRTVNLTWATATNASSNNIYRDYNLVGNTTSNSFSDTDVTIGEHLYFVRCVDSNGNVSLPSDIVPATVTFGNTLAELGVEHLQVAYNNNTNTATLQWEDAYRLNHVNYHSFEGPCYYWGPGAEEPFYWGARFPASMLPSSTQLTSASTYFFTSGTYTTYIYQCTSGTPTGTPIATVTGTYPKGWNNIALGSSINLDNQKDLWIVFKSTDIKWSVWLGEQNADDGNYYSYNGTNWEHLTGYSFFVSANLSNGSFSYTLYDHNESIATDLNAPIHSLSPSSDAAHLYTVKANNGVGFTPESNKAGLTIGTASLTSLELGTNDKMTITDGSSLTVTGSLTNTNPNNLIVENGAQLRHSSDNVMALVRKDIAPYSDPQTQNEGWYFIASPLTETTAFSGNGNTVWDLVTDSYTGDDASQRTFDFYYLAYENDKPIWKNYRQNSFDMNNGKGYLYASKNGTTLEFEGITKPYSEANNANEVTLDQVGWNLIGNPYTFATYIDQPYYTITHASSSTGITTSTEPTLASVAIPPCTGIVVKSSEADQKIHFTASPANPNAKQSNLQITLTKQAVTKDGISTNTMVIDNAIISFNEGEELEKFYFGENSAVIYIPQNGEEYAIVFNNNQNEIPLNFKASQDGTYTLNIKAEDLDLNYLHLIDNLTGDDVDLLALQPFDGPQGPQAQEPASYTFNAKTTDYVSRFRLMLAPICQDANGDNETFAYVDNGEIVITDVEACQGTALQVVDMTGRVIVCRDGVHTVSTSGITSGVYVLRLIDGENVRTQKIVIE